MDIRYSVLLIVLGSAAVTQVQRVLPLLLLSRVDLPPGFRVWLSYVPVAVSGALLANALFLREGRLVPMASNAALPAIAATLVIAAVTRSLIAAVAAGVAVTALLRSLG